MSKNSFTLPSLLVAAGLFACSSPATDAQIEQMCNNKAKLEGVLRATSATEAAAKVNEEYVFKKKKLDEEEARDIKGLDDVLEVRLKELEQGELQLPEDPEKSPEEIKESMKQDTIADIEKKKKPIREQYDRLREVLGPQREHALEQAKRYSAERKEKADEALAECGAAAKKKVPSAKLATCRIQAESTDAYQACR